MEIIINNLVVVLERRKLIASLKEFPAMWDAWPIQTGIGLLLVCHKEGDSSKDQRVQLSYGSTEQCFQQEIKQNVANDLLYSFERTSAILGARLSRDITGIPSDTHVLWGSRLDMKTEYTEGVICISPYRDSFVRGKSY